MKLIVMGRGRRPGGNLRGKIGGGGHRNNRLSTKLTSQTEGTRHCRMLHFENIRDHKETNVRIGLMLSMSIVGD